MSIMDLPSHTSVAVAGFLVLLSLCISWLRFTPNVPADLPWAGHNGESFLWRLRAAMKCLKSPQENLREGYKEYHQKGKSYIFPALRGPSQIMIPHARLRWLLDYPDHTASVSEAHFDLLAGDYAFTSPDMLHNPFHETVIHHNLTRKLGSLIPGTWAEVQFQIDSAFGLDSAEWKELYVTETMTSIITALSNLLIVGLPLCRNKSFQNIVINFTLGVVATITLLPIVPQWLQPLAGRLLAIPNHIFVWQSKKHVIPLIKERIADIENLDKDQPDADVKHIPEDYLTWHIRTAIRNGSGKELVPDQIARRIMPLEFAAIHTSSLSITNVLLDLVGSDPDLGYIESLREEVTTVFEAEGGVWSKQSLAKLIKTDSAIRESMRVSGFMTRGLQRKVLDKNGLKSEEGWTAPYGSMIATDVWSRHHDPSVYPDPDRYDAFRFSRSREQANEKASSEGHLRSQNLSLISTGENFLPFGHGRHACPGRFFINMEFKLLLAYILMNYDIQPLAQRPPNVLMGDAILPPRKASIRVKRKTEHVAI